MWKRWLAFWISILVAIAATGAWQVAANDIQTKIRGHELATRQEEMPFRTALAGINVELTQYDDINAELEQIAALGFTWVRQPFLWADIEPTQGAFNWETYDRIVAAVEDFPTLELVALLDGTPSWARHEEAPEHPFAPPASPAAFGEFAQALAERYGDEINYYQIWDEPNLEGHWGNLNPRPALYVAMLEASYSAIHTADANAMVIMAALAPTVETGPENINDPAYLQAVYELGGGDFFDAAAGKPYGFDLPPDDLTVDVDTLNFSRIILLREEMVRQGDGDKPLWGSNFGWNTLPDDWTGLPSIWGSADDNKNYTKSAYGRAQREWPWLTGLILQHWEPDAPLDDPIQGFAVAPEADAWVDVVPQATTMPSGLFPAQNPFATYEGDWQFGTLGADAGANANINTITIPFEGTEFALSVRRGDYLAYLTVTIDGENANELPNNNDGDAFIALTSERREPTIDLILAASDLTEGEHTAVITHRPELGDDQWPIVGFAVAMAPDVNMMPQRVAQATLLGAVLIALAIAVRLPWRSVKLPSPASLRNLGDLILGVFFSGVMIAGALLTWQDTLSIILRREVPTVVATALTSTILYYAPATWIAFIALLVTGIVIFNRPLIGILSVLFWSAFFTTNLDPFFRAVTILDVVLILTALATVSALLYRLVQEKRSLRAIFQQLTLHPLDIALVGLVALGIFSLTWSDLLPEATRELRVMIINPVVFYFLIRILRPNRRDLAFLVEALLITGFILALIGLVTYISGENVVEAEQGTQRLTSVYGSPNAVGLMLGRCVPFALAYLLLPVGQWRKVLAGITGLTMLIAIALSQSVGAILLGVPAAFGVVILGWRGKRALIPLGGLAAAGAVALIPLSQILPRLRQIADFENNTTVFRLNLWRSTSQLLQDQPLTGVGLDQFLYVYRSRYILPEAWQDPDLSHPHNVLMDYWVRLGILGVLLAIALQWFFWRQALRVYHAVRDTDPLKFAILLGTMGAMANFLAHGLVDMAYFAINLSYVFALLLALVVQLDDAQPSP